MKIYINLLPDSRKREIIRKKRLKNIIKQEMMFLFPVIIFILILFSINMILKIQNDSVDSIMIMANSKGKYQDLILYEDGFKNINKKVLDINKFQENHLHWFSVIKSLAEIVPSGIYLSDLSTSDYKIFLVGKAREREILIAFQDKMNGFSCFENINVPLSNLVEKSDIDFQMDFDVKKDCLIEAK